MEKFFHVSRKYIWMKDFLLHFRFFCSSLNTIRKNLRNSKGILPSGEMKLRTFWSASKMAKLRFRDGRNNCEAISFVAYNFVKCFFPWSRKARIELESKWCIKIKRFQLKATGDEKGKNLWQEGIGKLIWTREPFSLLEHQKFIRLWESLKSRYLRLILQWLKNEFFVICYEFVFAWFSCWNLFLRASSTKGSRGYSLFPL